MITAEPPNEWYFTMHMFMVQGAKASTRYAIRHESAEEEATTRL